MSKSAWAKRAILEPVILGRDIAPLLARFAVGTLFLTSGWGKLHKLGEFVAYFGELGIPAPEFMGRLVAATELMGGALLLIGLLTRLATIPLIITMIVALLTALREKVTGLSELFSLSEALYIVLLVWLALEGAGRISIDELIRRRLSDNRRVG